MVHALRIAIGVSRCTSPMPFPMRAASHTAVVAFVPANHRQHGPTMTKMLPGSWALQCPKCRPAAGQNVAWQLGPAISTNLSPRSESVIFFPQSTIMDP